MKKILVVDDIADNRSLLELLFETDPYELLFAENGHQALSLALVNPPDLVLLDVKLPDNIDGYQICRELRNHQQTRQSIIIMVTVHGQLWDRKAGFEAGADEYVVKPYSPLKLREYVNAILLTPS